MAMDLWRNSPSRGLKRIHIQKRKKAIIVQKQLFYCPKQVKLDQRRYKEKAMDMQQDDS